MPFLILYPLVLVLYLMSIWYQWIAIALVLVGLCWAIGDAIDVFTRKFC
jgi:hypothetical protein